MAIVEKYGDEAMLTWWLRREAERLGGDAGTGNLAKSGYVGTRNRVDLCAAAALLAQREDGAQGWRRGWLRRRHMRICWSLGGASGA